jgi:2-oxoglutarate dehydrogenase E1 component
MLRCASRLLRNQTTRIRKNFASTASFDDHSDNFLSGDNALYVEEMFDQWKSDRTAVHSSWDAYFTNLSNGLESKDAFKPAPMGQSGFTPMAAYTQSPTSTENSGFTDHYQNVFQEKLASMILRYRRRAHEIATIDPLNIEENVDKFRVKFKPVEETPETYGFNAADLDKPIEYYSRLRGFHQAKKQWTPQEASQLLQEIYSGNISYEYMHIHHVEIHDWIRDRIENRPPFKLSKDQKYNLLDRILESQAFTDFCDKKYSSSKRFGIEGLDSAISGMEALVDSAKDLGVSHVIVGMAHRGRLNTLACVFDKPYEAIFTEFKDPGISKNLKSAEWGFSGDVKYHLGASNQRTYPDGSRISMV